MRVTLQKCTISDTAEIAALADIIWHQHYSSIITQEQIRYMLTSMYSHQSLSEQMQNKGHVFYFIVQEQQRIGFLSVHEISKGSWFLNKFYILQELAGKGGGTAAFQEIVNLHQMRRIELTVNRQNFKSINFYFKNGFKISSVADFDIGNGYFMNDFIMVWEG